MPDPFQPKFVDLVRNFTTTQGTGNFVLGAAVAGHTSLASAVAAGERFYYCAMGVDKPAEREVGRGTKLANGTISREPISGPLTNFSNGTKTISLVVAANWFDDVGAWIHAGAGNLSALSTTDKTSLVAAVNEIAGTGSAGGMSGGRELIFATAAGASIGATVTGIDTSGYSAAGKGAARYTYDAAIDAAYVAANPRAAFLAANGRGFRLDQRQPLDVMMFGAAADDVSDDLPAFAAALDYLKLWGSVFGKYNGGPRLHIPAGKYYLSETLDIVGLTAVIEGDGSGMAAGPASRLRWPAGQTGIRVQRFNTSGADGAAGVTAIGGDGCIIRGLYLRGGYSTAGGEGEFHGIHLRGRTAIEDCFIENFPGDGIYIRATAGSGTVEGNANNWSINRCRIIENRDGIQIDGADVNAGVGILIDASANRRWGINDSSFLGNTFIGCHSDANGIGPSLVPTLTSHNGNRYAVIEGQAVGASTNAPTGTAAHNTWWHYVGLGGPNVGNSIPGWASGANSYREGGAYRTDSPNARTIFIGCYSEGSQGPAQTSTCTQIMGGEHGAGVRGGPALLAGLNELYCEGTGIGSRSADSSVKTMLTSDTTLAKHLNLVHTTHAPSGYGLQWFSNGRLSLSYANSGSNRPFEISGPTSTLNIGTHKMNFPALFGIADKKMLNGTVAPASGAFVQGDICWNSAPAAGGAPGWVCVTGGSPGTWKAMGALAA